MQGEGKPEGRRLAASRAVLKDLTKRVALSIYVDFEMVDVSGDNPWITFEWASWPSPAGLRLQTFALGTLVEPVPSE